MAQLAQQTICELVELSSISHQKLNYYQIQKLGFYQLMRKFQLQKIHPLPFWYAPIFSQWELGKKKKRGKKKKTGIGKRKEEEDKKNHFF